MAYVSTCSLTMVFGYMYVPLGSGGMSYCNQGVASGHETRHGDDTT